MQTIMTTWAVLAVLVMITMAAPSMAERGNRGDKPKLDTDGDGYVSQAEWDANVQRDDVSFSEVDTDGDGRLSKDELRELFKDRVRRNKRERNQSF